MSEVKKGRPSWKPASRLEVRNKPDGYRLRWVNKTDSANVNRKLAEDWIYANKIEGFDVEHAFPGLVQDGKALTSTPEYREHVLMAIPEDRAKERDEHYAKETQKQTAGLKHKAKEDNAENARKHGAPGTELTGRITIIE